GCQRLFQQTCGTDGWRTQQAGASVAQYIRRQFWRTRPEGPPVFFSGVRRPAHSRKFAAASPGAERVAAGRRVDLSVRRRGPEREDELPGWLGHRSERRLLQSARSGG